MDKTNDPRWKVISSKYISKKPWFTVRQECVELPNGSRIPEYFVLEYPEWVNVIAVTPDNRFVMIRQYRHALGKTGLELPAGVGEPGDASPLETARRELLEETGFGGGEWTEFMTLSANPTTHTNLTHVFLARDVIKLCAPAPEDTENLTVMLMEAAEVRRLLENGEIVQALMAAPLWKYFAAGK
ncbi:MAG: NUDIX hydrolase [Victivallaceae bacterium]|nr:NUDIX hydrolase [Victivallaceae bacterium]